MVIDTTTGQLGTAASGAGAGSVTSVAALTLTSTSGSDLSSSVATATSTPVITLNVPTASAANRGALSATDWSTFNGKESVLTFSTPLSRSTNTISLGTVGVANGGTGLTAGGSDGQVLTMVSGAPAWATASGLPSDASSNTLAGTGALPVTNTSGGNSAFGYQALNKNSALTSYSTAVGWKALNNSSGNLNTAVGAMALDYLTSPSGSNTALGGNAGLDLLTGTSNTFIGTNAGQNGTPLQYGDNNLYLGAGAAASAAGTAGTPITNEIVIGQGATGLGSNKVRIGNSSVTVIQGQVAWTNTSDRRLKQDIVDSQLGLAFIQKLRPVTYTFITQPTVTHEGLIAQEVEAAAQSLGTVFHGLQVPSRPEDHYALTYSDLVMPLINAAKELKAENDQLHSEVDTLKADNQATKAELATLKAQVAAILARLPQ